MHKLNSKLVMAVAIAASLMAGCGGGGGGFINPPATAAPAPGTGGTGAVGVVSDISKSVTDLFAYISGLILGVGENGDLVDVNAITLATDDASPPISLD